MCICWFDSYRNVEHYPKPVEVEGGHPNNFNGFGPRPRYSQCSR